MTLRPLEMSMSPKRLLEEMFVLPPGSDKTFSHDESLPSLPVPALRNTLDRYIESIKPFVTKNEFAETERSIRQFEKGVGKELHAKLLQRAATHKNWVEKWWEDYAYLSNRQPLMPHCSMSGVNLTTIAPNQVDDTQQIKTGALYLHHMANIWLLLRREQMKPTQGADGTYFSMMQFRRLFNTVRVPGVERDSLISHFKTESEGTCPSHVVVLCRGRVFVTSAVTADGNAVSPGDWERMLTDIRKRCAHHAGQGVGLLTSDDRTTWAKNREHLASLSFENRETLRLIETSVCYLVLDNEGPRSDSDIVLASLAGDFQNRWADKSIGVFAYRNGALGGLCDHTAFDGMISVATMYYVYIAMTDPEMISNSESSQNLKMPMELEFHIDAHIRSELDRSVARSEENGKLLVVVSDSFKGFGKTQIQAHRLHPDTFVQMALQLAFYRLHKQVPPTYETATTRSFYNGRTETVRACTVESMEWVRAMLNHKITAAEKKRLLKIAMDKHDQLMKEARENAGCDRHLFGMYCIALEEGLPIPDIYSQPAYTKSGGGGNFMLSTSLVGYTPIGGTVAPMCTDGYGCFYNLSPNSIRASIAAWRYSSESSASKFFACIEKSLEDMMTVLGPVPGKL